MSRSVAISVSALLLSTTLAFGAPKTPYAPYEFLIGEWDVAPASGPALGVARFRLASGGRYIWHSMSLLENGAEKPHYEGMLVWNGVHRNLDMLISVDGGLEEQGTVSVQADGTVVREITAYAAAGEPRAPAHFRQTFQASANGQILTTVMRETPNGWVPTFPGSDRLFMTRRAAV